MAKTQTPAPADDGRRRGGYDPQRYARVIRPARPPEGQALTREEIDARLRRCDDFFTNHDDEDD